MKIRSLLVAAALALGVLVLPQPASAGHCAESLFILTGAGVEGVYSQGVNAGAAGCTLEPEGVEVDTNITTPGAPNAVVAWTGPAPSGGHIDISGAIHGLNWHYNDVRTRWESQPVPMGAPAPMTSITAVHGGQSVTYTRSI